MILQKLTKYKKHPSIYNYNNSQKELTPLYTKIESIQYIKDNILHFQGRKEYMFDK